MKRLYNNYRPNIRIEDSKKISFRGMFTFAVAMILIGITMYTITIPNAYNNEKLLFTWSWIANIILCWSVYILTKKCGYIFNQYVIFIFSLFAFSLGQIHLFSIGISYEKFDLTQIYHSNILKGTIYACLGLFMFVIGGIRAIDTKEKKIFKKVNEIDDSLFEKKLNMAMNIIAWFMIIVSVYVYYNYTIMRAILSISGGYSAVYENEVGFSNGIIDSLRMLYIPGIFLLVASKKEKLGYRLFFWGIILFSTLLIFATGGRSTGVALFLSALLFWHTCIQKLSKNGKRMVAILMVVVILLMPIVGAFRGQEGKSIGSFVTLFSEKVKEDNLIVSTLGELGGSMQPWLLVDHIIPDKEPYKYGESYIASILAVVPSSLLFGYNAAKKAALGQWLQKAAYMTYGPGFSLLAECYYNFGWLGIPFMWIIGYVFFRFLGGRYSNKYEKYLSDIFGIIALHNFITIARSSMYLSIRYQLYTVIIPYILIKLIINSIKKNKMYRLN